MKTDVEIIVNPDRPLEDREEMEFDDEGNLIIVEKTKEESEKPADEHASTEEDPAKEQAATKETAPEPEALDEEESND